MTGKEAIIHYLGTHKKFCAQDVARVPRKWHGQVFWLSKVRSGERCITGLLPEKNGKER